MDDKVIEDPQTGAQGESISDGDPGRLLADERYVKADAALLRRAVREGWDIPAPVRDSAVARMAAIVKKPHVLVPTAEGSLVENEAIADANAIAASRVLVSMTGQNQADDHHADDLEVKKANAVSAAVQAGLVPKNYHGLDPNRV